MRIAAERVLGTLALSMLVLGAACSRPPDPANGPSAAGPAATDAFGNPMPEDTTAGAAFAAKDPPAKVQFLAAGNAICRTTNEQSAALSDQQGEDRSPTAGQQLIEQNAAPIAASVAQLRALPQPPGDEAKLATMYAAVDQLVSDGHAMAAALGQGDTATWGELASRAQTEQTAANQQFTAYGLTECGKGG
jgi:hypothetical protein